MSKYVDGFVISVPGKNIPKYLKMAKLASKVSARFHAVIDYFEQLQMTLSLEVDLRSLKA